MPLIKIDRAFLAFGHHPLLDNAHFQADGGERVALIGRNGTGKSSLLLVLAGFQALDDGLLWCAPNIRIGFVPQEPLFEKEDTVFSAVVSGMGDISRLLTQYHQISHDLSLAPTPSDSEALLLRLSALQGEMERQGAWNQQSKAEQIINTFGLLPDTPVSSLSGGQKKRLALARALAHSPDVLLLDEPTNHLDISAIVWLESMLTHPSLAKVCIIFITHDRSFLQNVATRIVELDRGALQSFPGNFNTYLARKALLLHEEAQENARADKLLKAEEVWIRKGVEARRTRSVYRVAQLESLRKARAERRVQMGRATIELDRGEKSGQLVAELKAVSHSFVNEAGQEKIILRDFSTRIMAGDKIGLIGRNGAGKTTLLRLILGELTPTAGTVRLGTKIAVAYFDQFRAGLNLEARLIDVIGSESEFVEINGKKKHVIGYLEDFLFPPERARSQVKMLSGGERNRLLLAKLFARPANVLVLDEPTNDLDIETLELLEQLLADYTGTVFLVSHDRQFLDNIVTQSIVFEGGNEGRWREFVGGFSDWRAQTTVPLSESFASPVEGGAAIENNGGLEKSPHKDHAKDTRTTKIAANKGVKLSWKENKELGDIPNTIAQLEAEQKVLSKKLEDPNLYSQAQEEARSIAARLSDIEETLITLLDRWETLESKSRGE